MLTSAWYVCRQGRNPSGMLMHRDSSNFPNDTSASLWLLDRRGLWAGHCRAGMTSWHNDGKRYGNAKSLLCNREKAKTTARNYWEWSIGWNHYCQHFNFQHKGTGGKGENDIYERQLNTRTLPPAQGSTKPWVTANQVSILGGNCPALPPLCYWSVTETQYWQKEPRPGPEGFCHFFSLIFSSRAGDLKNVLQLQMKAKDSNDTLGDPSQQPPKPGKGAHSKWI